MSGLGQLRSLLNLLGACYNPNCGVGCGFFSAASDGPVAPTTWCVICRCFAAQHVPRPPAGTETSSSSAGQTPSAAFFSAGRASAPSEPPSVFASRAESSAASNSSSFPDTSKAKNPLTGHTAHSTTFCQMLKETARFNPAEKQRADRDAAAPGTKKPGSTASLGTVYNVFCLPDTKAISKGTRRLALFGQELRFHEAQTDSTIAQLISDAFLHIPEVQTHGYRPCRMKTVQGGTSDCVTLLGQEPRARHRISFPRQYSASLAASQRLWDCQLYWGGGQGMHKSTHIPAEFQGFLVAEKIVIQAKTDRVEREALICHLPNPTALGTRRTPSDGSDTVEKRLHIRNLRCRALQEPSLRAIVLAATNTKVRGNAKTWKHLFYISLPPDADSGNAA
ncbi:hypothetical protein C8F01DRAFT_1088324 [Mycena amicta]|nr:hypothetical protein C8F01DRAFT_1088324 [Mycena amicta]